MNVSAHTSNGTVVVKTMAFCIHALGKPEHVSLNLCLRMYGNGQACTIRIAFEALCHSVVLGLHRNVASSLPMRDNHRSMF